MLIYPSTPNGRNQWIIQSLYRLIVTRTPSLNLVNPVFVFYFFLIARIRIMDYSISGRMVTRRKWTHIPINHITYLSHTHSLLLTLSKRNAEKTCGNCSFSSGQPRGLEPFERRRQPLHHWERSIRHSTRHCFSWPIWLPSGMW